MLNIFKGVKMQSLDYRKLLRRYDDYTDMVRSLDHYTSLLSLILMLSDAEYTCFKQAITDNVFGTTEETALGSDISKLFDAYRLGD